MIKLLAFVLLIFSQNVFAAVGPEYKWNAEGLAFNGKFFSSAMSACNAMKSLTSVQQDVFLSGSSETTKSCIYASGTGANYSVGRTSAILACTYPDIFDEVTQSCIERPCDYNNSGQHLSIQDGNKFCVDDCKLPYVEDASRSCYLPACPEGSFRDENNNCHVPECPLGQSRVDGVCVDPPPKECPAGTTNVGTSSYPVCVLGDGSSSSSTTSGDGSTASGSTTSGSTTSGSTTSGGTTSGSTTSGDGSTTSGSTTSGSTTSGDGSTTSGSTTSGSTTSGSTTSGSTTSGSTTSGDEPPADDFCSQNPNLTICKNSSVSGDCENITCEGDAISCAILRQQRKEYCENTKENPQTTLGNKLLTGDDPMQSNIDGAMKGDDVDLSGKSLDQTGFLGGGSCLHDRSISVSGHSVTVSFSAICNNIAPLRFVILACSMVAAYLLVSKSVLQG